jgi:hypothetical protein
MIELRTQLLLSLLVFLAAALEARSQTAPGSPLSNQALVHKTGKPGNSKTLPVRNPTTVASPGLCFQPGVGWQPNATGQPSGSATQPASASAGGANPPSVDASLLNAKQPHSARCGAILTDKKELGAGVETSPILSPNPAIGAAGSAKSGPVTSLQGNSPLHPNSFDSMRTTPNAKPSAPTRFASTAGPAGPSEQGDDRAFHAYISSIKLRRLIRHAPDFRTRMKLQQLQNNPATKVHHARADTKTGQLAGKPLQGKRVRPTISRKSNANGRPAGQSPRANSIP